MLKTLRYVFLDDVSSEFPTGPQDAYQIWSLICNTQTNDVNSTVNFFFLQMSYSKLNKNQSNTDLFG